MPETATLIGEVTLWVCWLIGMYLVWKLLGHFKPSLSFRSWGSLLSQFGIGVADLPAGLAMRGATVRVGFYKTDMAQVGVDDTFLYLRRPLSSSTDGLLRIPFHSMRLMSPPKRSGGLFNLPVAGIFKVDGVELWIGTPYAEHIITRLA